MSRYSGKRSYGHRCKFFKWLGGFYRISWTVDFYYPNSMLRHPRIFERDTDEKGARKFCKRWDIEFPST